MFVHQHKIRYIVFPALPAGVTSVSALDPSRLRTTLQTAYRFDHFICGIAASIYALRIRENMRHFLGELD